MGWFDWVYTGLAYLGLYYKNVRVLLVGLDNSGKTTLLGRLALGTTMAYTPTFQPNVQEVILGHCRFHVNDLGGHEVARKLWEDYYHCIDAIVFMVDVADHERLREASHEFRNLRAGTNVPILVLGNKIDVEGALSPHQLAVALGAQCTGKEEVALEPTEIFMCSVVKGMGYSEGLEWLTNQLITK